MISKPGWKRIRVVPNYLNIVAIMAVCAVLYYLPVIAGLAGWASLEVTMGRLHNLFGIDLYGIVFFAPVVYAAYVYGIIGALLAGFTSMLLLLPYAILIDTFPYALFKPSAFLIILSAVGAVVAMVQKSDEQRRRSIRELKCLYDVGKAAAVSDSVERFLSSVTALIPQAVRYPEATRVRISVRDNVFQSPGFKATTKAVAETLVVNGEASGSLEMYCTRSLFDLRKQNPFIKTLADRVGSAIHEVELSRSLRDYYERLEEMVEKRTREIEEVQARLIRSERLAAVGELASGVGHELRNPLNVIRNCTYLLNITLSEKDDDETRNTLKLMDRQIDLANRIVTDLLEFTRIRPPLPTVTDLNSLVKESLSWLEIPEGVTVTVNFNSGNWRVIADAEQVGRALTNIIANAVQAMDGRGDLKISTGIEDELAWIKFEDSGCGIPEENMARIFEPLFTTKAKGIGLGLPITKKLIEQNRGHIEVTSQLGRGTTFTVRLPIQKERQAEYERADANTCG